MLLYAQFFVTLLIWVLDVPLGMGRHLFVTLPWWDVPLHLLGGIWLGIFTAWAARLRGRKISIAECIFVGLAVGVAWELFERSIGIAGSIFMSYWADTVKDVLDDIIGAALGGLISVKIIKIWRK